MGRSQRHTSLQSQPWEVRPQDSDCSCQGDIFSPSSQVPASSASPACGLPVYFSPNRLSGGHGISAWTGIGREFRIWRRPCWSLSEWSVFPSPPSPPQTLFSTGFGQTLKGLPHPLASCFCPLPAYSNVSLSDSRILY